MGHVVVGHPHLEEKNHASKGVHKDMKLGGGGRFAALTHELAGKKGIYNPAGLAAAIGRKSLGKAKFQKLAAAHR